MHINITAQKIGKANANYNSSVTDFVHYLEKENHEREAEGVEHFFDQYHDKVDKETVIAEIDGNAAKLKKREPRFYSLVVSPSTKELQHIGNDPEKLRAYVRELMKEYAAAFNRDRKVTVDDIKYFAKIEHERTYRGFERKVQENAPYRKRIAKLEHDLVKVRNGEVIGNPRKIKKEIDRLMDAAPHKVNGKLFVEGMKKEGLQTHIHIIVSRKDATNTYSLSPGSKYKQSEVELNGKRVKRGFHRDQFFKAAEKRFDLLFGYDRNHSEQYVNRNLYLKDPKKFLSLVMGLPKNEREIALRIMHRSGLPTDGKGAAFTLSRNAGIYVPNVPTNQAQLAYRIFKRLRRGMEKAIESASIGI